MKIKEAYHYLTVLSGWESKIRMAMTNQALLKKTTELHRKSIVMAGEADETREVVNKELDYTYDDLVKLWEAIINEKKKIYALIEAKKLEKNIPSTLYTINKSYRDLIQALSYSNNSATRSVSTRKETGFVKGNDGVGSYTYDVEVTTEPKYKTEYFLEKLDKLTKIADDTSNAIDSFDTNVDIDYQAKWSEHSLLENLLK